MIYTVNTKKALKFMFEAHKNQKDKSGIPYVFHPYTLADKMDDEESTIVALLHDVVEDTDFTIKDIKNLGFSDKVIDAINALTHLENEEYFDYIQRISQNQIAIKVKLADLYHNSDLSRLDEIKDSDLQRYKKYQECIKILTANKTK